MILGIVLLLNPAGPNPVELWGYLDHISIYVYPQVYKLIY
jgi:hypothetical protein